LVFVHVAAAFKHQWISKHRLIQRMLTSSHTNQP
jgi:cytochrome b561